MTREAIRAEQEDAAGPAPQLTRVIITAVQTDTVTVTLPGGASTKAPRIAGAAYTPGGLGYALVQEPAVGPVTPIGNDVALSNRRAVLQQDNGISPQTGTIDINPSTVISDPSGMASGAGFKALWSGLYRIGCRAAVNGGDIAPANVVVIDCIDAASGSTYGQVGQYGMASDVPMQYFDDIVLTAGATFRFRLRWGGGASRGLSYGDQSVRPRIFAQYLGPA